jgi:hypothetical protein
VLAPGDRVWRNNVHNFGKSKAFFVGINNENIKRPESLRFCCAHVAAPTGFENIGKLSLYVLCLFSSEGIYIYLLETVPDIYQDPPLYLLLYVQSIVCAGPDIGEMHLSSDLVEMFHFFRVHFEVRRNLDFVLSLWMLLLPGFKLL